MHDGRSVFGPREAKADNSEPLLRQHLLVAVVGDVGMILDPVPVCQGRGTPVRGGDRGGNGHGVRDQ